MRRFGPRVAIRTVVDVLGDVARFGILTLRSRTQLTAENLFLRKQLALYIERQVKPHRADDSTRIALVALSRFVDWRQLLVIVKPDTLIRWHIERDFGCSGGGNQTCQEGREFPRTCDG